MKYLQKIKLATMFSVLDIAKFILLMVLLTMFVNFNARAAQQAEETKSIAASTNRVVKSQEDILQAIKQVTDDTRITAREQTAIIICMLQVETRERSDALLAACRQDAAESGVDNAPGTSRSSSGINQGNSLSKPTGEITPPQSNTSQP
jgi:hypothetical protein